MNKHSYIQNLCRHTQIHIMYTYIYLLMKMHIFISILPDIDECNDGTDNCPHICTNTIGSFFCGCNDGFLLDIDQTACIGMH